MDSKPLSYDSLQCILQYMDANQRFQLSHWFPSIRLVEKVVPLTIKFLKLYHNGFRVNDTSYQLGVIRHFTDGQPHSYIEQLNADGGVRFDLDKFGGEDKSVDYVVTPGDVLIESEKEPRNEEEENEDMRRLQRRLVKLQNMDKNESEQIQMETIEDCLFHWRNQREIIGTSYKAYIQLTIEEWRRENEIETVNGNKTMEHMVYNRKLYQATKYLTTVFFGERKDTMTVHEFECDWCKIIRFPEMTKIKIRNLTIKGNVASMMNSLEPLLDTNSFPMHRVYIISPAYFDEVQNHEHSVITTSDELYMGGCGHSFAIILNAKNRLVQVANSWYTPDQLISLLDKMLENKRQIGTVSKTQKQ